MNYKKTISTFTLAMALCMSIGHAKGHQASSLNNIIKPQPSAHLLWYDKPATTWTEALPIGNSRLGAMIFGVPSAERLQLNEETIWAGRPNNNANPEALEYLPKVRQLVWEGKYKEAQDMATKHVQAQTNSGMPYQPFGDLFINFPGIHQYQNYYQLITPE